jgi:hypothetical protein
MRQIHFKGFAYFILKVYVIGIKGFAVSVLVRVPVFRTTI